MERRRAVVILPEEPRMGTLPWPLHGGPNASVHVPMEAVAPASLKRDGDVTPSAAPAQCEAADVQVTVPGPASQGAFVSDAALEPVLAAARDRRASYLRAGFPIVSVVVFAAILCVAWLL